MVLAVASNWNVTKGEFDIYHWARQVSDDVRFVMIGLTKTQIRKLPINILGFERTEDINQLVDFLFSSRCFYKSDLSRYFSNSKY